MDKLSRRLVHAPVDDGGAVAVQVDQAAQDLPRPALKHLHVYVAVALAIPAGSARSDTVTTALAVNKCWKTMPAG